MKNRNNCKYYLYDRSTGQADCFNNDMTSDELTDYFTDDQPNCKYHKYDYVNINIIVFNDDEKVFSGSAADFLNDNIDTEDDIDEMLIEVIETGKSKRDFYYSGIWEIILNNQAEELKPSDESLKITTITAGGRSRLNK